MDTQTETQKRKRKALLVLPLIALPFVALAFWSLGGGKGNAQPRSMQQKGINTALPAAQLSGSPQDKMSLYSQAAADSGTLNAYAGSGPYGRRDSLSVNPEDSMFTGGTAPAGDAAPDEAKVQAKLAQLQQIISQPPSVASGYTTYGTQPDARDEGTKADMARLQQMMQAMQHTDDAPDPQMAQMNGMLDKLLDIEHPERAEEQLRRQSLKNRGRVYAVSQPQEQDSVSLLAPGSSSPVYSGSGFYDLGQDAVDTLPAAIPAVVQGTQTVTSGATIKLRLTADILVSGIVIPGNNFIYGTCNVDGERLKIRVTGIRYHDHLFPVSLSVYDPDALEGIRIPGAISRDASKEGADRAVQSVQLMSLDPSLGAQAASAGLEAAKGLISKKVKLVRVTVKAGYPVLLMDEKAKQENSF